MAEQNFEALLIGLRGLDTKVRQRSAYQLGELGDRQAVEPLINALDDDDPVVVSHAATSLGRLGDERAIEPLIKHLNHQSVVHGLEDLGENALLAVIDVLRTTSGKERLNALQGIRQFHFSHWSWARPIIEQQAFEKVLQVLEDTDEHNRGYAVVILGDIGNVEAVERIQGLVHDPSDYVRWCVAQVLGKLGNTTTIPLLEEMQRNDKGTVSVYNPEDGDGIIEKISDVADGSIQIILTRSHR